MLKWNLKSILSLLCLHLNNRDKVAWANRAMPEKIRTELCRDGAAIIIQ